MGRVFMPCLMGAPLLQNAIFSVSTAMGISLIGINPYQSELAERVNGVMRHVDFWMKCHGKRVEFTTLDSSSDISPYHLTNAETCHIINFPDKTTLSAKDKAACVVGMYAPKASRAFPFSISSSCILMWSGAEATESVTIEPMAAYRSSIVLACLSNTEGDLGSVYLSPFSFYECKSIRLVAAFAKVVTISSDAFWCCSKNEIIVLVHAYATVRITGKPPPQVTVMAIETGKPPVNLSRVSATDDEYMSITCPCQALVDFDRCFMPCRLVHTPKCSIRKASAPRRSSYVGTITTKGGLPDVTRLFK